MSEDLETADRQKEELKGRSPPLFKPENDHVPNQYFAASGDIRAWPTKLGFQIRGPQTPSSEFWRL